MFTNKLQWRFCVTSVCDFAITIITSGNQMRNKCESNFYRIDFVVIPSYIELTYYLYFSVFVQIQVFSLYPYYAQSNRFTDKY